MIEVFSGWRRKLGIVTLLMTLTTMLGWMRSLVTTDFVWIHTSDSTLITISSIDQRFALGLDSRAAIQSTPRFFEWHTEPFHQLDSLWDDLAWTAKWQFLGFAYVEVRRGSLWFGLFLTGHSSFQ